MQTLPETGTPQGDEARHDGAPQKSAFAVDADLLALLGTTDSSEVPGLALLSKLLPSQVQDVVRRLVDAGLVQVVSQGDEDLQYGLTRNGTEWLRRWRCLADEMAGVPIPNAGTGTGSAGPSSSRSVLRG